MGFWDVTKRIIQGKPAFEVPDEKDGWEDNEPTIDFAEEREAKKQATQQTTGNNTDDTGLYDEKGHKHPPVVIMANIRTKLDSDHIEVWTTIKNQSNRDVELDKVTLLGTRLNLRYPLKAGDQRVFRVYSGPQLTHDHYKKAELYYKNIPNGDYFRADHLLQYAYEANKTYEVVGCSLLPPIRDL